MLKLSAKQRVIICLTPTDMRKGFVSLALLVREAGYCLAEGILFVFFSRDKSRVKILAWDGDGYALFYKKLEEDTFRLTYSADSAVEELSGVDLEKLLSGISLQRLRLQKKVAAGVLAV